MGLVGDGRAYQGSIVNAGDGDVQGGVAGTPFIVVSGIGKGVNQRLPGIKGLHRRVKIIDGVAIATIAIDHNAAIGAGGSGADGAAINGADHQGIGIRRAIGIIGQQVTVGGGAFFVDAIRIRDGKRCDVADHPDERIGYRCATVGGADFETIGAGPASRRIEGAGNQTSDAVKAQAIG